MKNPGLGKPAPPGPKALGNPNGPDRPLSAGSTGLGPDEIARGPQFCFGPDLGPKPFLGPIPAHIFGPGAVFHPAQMFRTSSGLSPAASVKKQGHMILDAHCPSALGFQKAGSEHPPVRPGPIHHGRAGQGGPAKGWQSTHPKVWLNFFPLIGALWARRLAAGQWAMIPAILRWSNSRNQPIILGSPLFRSSIVWAKKTFPCLRRFSLGGGQPRPQKGRLAFPGTPREPSGQWTPSRPTPETGSWDHGGHALGALVSGSPSIAL